MVEIGPGLAALTEPVGERLDKLTVIELDRDLAVRLQTHPAFRPETDYLSAGCDDLNFGELPTVLGSAAACFRQPAL